MATETTDTQETNEAASGETNEEVMSREIKPNLPVRKNDPRTSVQKTEEYRFANNIPSDRTIP